MLFACLRLLLLVDSYQKALEINPHEFAAETGLVNIAKERQKVAKLEKEYMDILKRVRGHTYCLLVNSHGVSCLLVGLFIICWLIC